MTEAAPRRSSSQKVAIVAPLVVGLLLYPVNLFFVQYLVAGVSVGTASRHVLEGLFEPGVNYFLVSLLCAVPFALLSLVLFLQSRRGLTRITLGLAIGGLVGICWVLIPGYFSLEASFYGPDRPSSTAALGYLFAPVYALPFLAVGLVVGWIASRVPWWSDLGRVAARRPAAIALGSLLVAAIASSLALIWAGQVRAAHELYGIATSPQTTADELRELAQVDDLRLRTYVMENRNVDGDILRQLAGDPRLREAVASHPKTPDELLRDFAEEDTRALDGALARNPSTPTDILERLRDRASPTVRSELAENPSTPAWILEEVYRDSPRDAASLAGNPSTPPAIIAALASSPNPDVRRAAAQNPSAPPQVLTDLAVDDDWPVRAAVARNPGTPQPALEALGRDGDDRLPWAVARNPSFAGATIDLAGVELEWQPNVWTAVQTGENSFFLLRRYDTPLRDVFLESYPVSLVGSGGDEVDLAAIAADGLTHVNKGPGSRVTNPTHRTITLGDRQWGWTRFEGPWGQVLNHIYAPVCDRVISLRFAHPEDAMSQRGYRSEFDAVTFFLRLMRKACDNGEPAGLPVRPAVADGRRVVVESPLISKRSGLPGEGRVGNEAPLLFEGPSDETQATVEWNGWPVHASGRDGRVAILASGDELLASSDLAGLDSISLIQATPFCLGGDGQRALAVYVQVGEIGGRGAFVIYAPGGTIVYQESLEPALGQGIFLDRGAESRELMLEHGGQWTYECLLEGAWSDL